MFKLSLFSTVLLFLLFSSMGTSASKAAQDGLEDLESSRLTYGFTFQPRLSVITEVEEEEATLGFGILRGFFRTNFQLTEDLRFYAQFGNTAAGNYSMLDLFAEYQFADAWSVKGGRFSGAQPRAAGFTGNRIIESTNRQLAARRWTQLRGDLRDFGVETRYAEGAHDLRFYLSNGDGRYPTGNLRSEADSRPASAMMDRSPSLSAYYNHTLNEGVSLGGYTGFSLGSETAVGETAYQAGSVHYYHGALPGSRDTRFKAEIMGWNFSDDVVLGENEAGLIQWGGYILAAQRISDYTEIIGSFDFYDGNTEGAHEEYKISVGLQYSLAERFGGSFHDDRIMFMVQPYFSEERGDRVAAILQLQLSI